MDDSNKSLLMYNLFSYILAIVSLLSDSWIAQKGDDSEDILRYMDLT